MEYTFKNSLIESAQTIILNADDLIIQLPESQKIVTYQNIQSVKLSKRKKHLFSLELMFNNSRSIHITNKYFVSAKDSEDRSRTYETFVRVLHFHLREKGKATYYSGFSIKHLVRLIVCAAFGSFIVSFISEFFGFSITNSLIQALILTVIVVTVILIANRKLFPRVYSPSDIPPQFLP